MSGTNADADIRIRPAVESDADAIHGLIRELADYEKMSDEVEATSECLRRWLFGADPVAEALVAEADGRPVGFALYFRTYSTFVGRPGYYLEDLFVQPAFRGRGIGKALLKRLAALAVERGCGRLEWAVLNWNEPAIKFYERMNARPMDQWTTYRLDGEALARLGSSKEMQNEK